MSFKSIFYESEREENGHFRACRAYRWRDGPGRSGGSARVPAAPRAG